MVILREESVARTRSWLMLKVYSSVEFLIWVIWLTDTVIVWG